MEIKILSREMAIKRIPEKPELMIGILDSKNYRNNPNNFPITNPLNNLRINYLSYILDDIEEPFQDFVLITRETAKQILEDFAEHKDKIESLAVHCRAGLSRSPAVAAALNDCFFLGNSPEEFFSGGYTPNRTVYRTICRTAKELGICTEDFLR